MRTGKEKNNKFKKVDDKIQLKAKKKSITLDKITKEVDTARGKRYAANRTDKNFDNYLMVSAFFSAKMEGNSLDLNSFMDDQNKK